MGTLRDRYSDSSAPTEESIVPSGGRLRAKYGNVASEGLNAESLEATSGIPSPPPADDNGLDGSSDTSFLNAGTPSLLPPFNPPTAHDDLPPYYSSFIGPQKAKDPFLTKLIRRIGDDLKGSFTNQVETMKGAVAALRDPVSLAINFNKMTREKNLGILEDTRQSFENTKELYKGGHWLLGTLSTLDYLSRPLTSFVDRYITEPLKKDSFLLQDLPKDFITNSILMGVPLPKVKPGTLPKIELFDPSTKGKIPGFHGTAEDFRLFKRTRDIGYHFTVNKEVARNVARSRSIDKELDPTGGTIIKSYLDVKNPIVLDDLGQWTPATIVKSVDENYTFANGSLRASLFEDATAVKVFDAQLKQVFKRLKRAAKSVEKEARVPTSGITQRLHEALIPIRYKEFRQMYVDTLIDNNLSTKGSFIKGDFQDYLSYAERLGGQTEAEVVSFRDMIAALNEPAHTLVRRGIKRKGYDSIAYVNDVEFVTKQVTSREQGLTSRQVTVPKKEWSFIVFDQAQIKRPFYEKLNVPYEESKAVSAFFNRVGGGRSLPYFSQLGKDVADVVYGRSSEYLRDLSRVSPTLRKIVDAMGVPIHSNTPLLPDYIESIGLARGRFGPTLEDIFNSPNVRKSSIRGRVPDASNVELSKGLRGEAYNPIFIPEVKRLRGWLDEVFLYLKDAGLDVKYHKDFLPRRYNINLKNRSAFAELLRTKGYNEARIADVLYDIENNNGFSLLSRTLDDIPDRELAPFLENNVYKTLQEYLNTVTSSAEFHRNFSWSKNLVTKTRMQEAIRKEAAAFDIEVRPQDFDRIDNILKAFTHTYKKAESAPVRAAIPFIKSYQYLRLLPYSAVTNTIDFLNNAYYYKPSFLIDAVPAAVDQVAGNIRRIVNKSAAKPELQRFLESFTGSLDDVVAGQMSEVWSTPRQFSHVGFKINGMQTLGNAQKMFSFRTGLSVIEDRLKLLLEETTRAHLDPKYRPSRYLQSYTEDLIDFGIDTTKFVGYGESLANMARQNPAQYEAMLEQIIKVDNKREIGKAAVRFMGRTAFHPTAANRPLRFSSDYGSLVSQLQSYFVQFTNTVFPVLKKDIINRMKGQPSVAIENALRAATTGALMAGAGYLVYNVKLGIKYDEKDIPKDRDPKNMTNFKKFMVGVDTSGMLGVGNVLSNVAGAVKYGGSPIDVIAGPTLSQAGALVKGGVQAAQGKPKRLEDELIGGVVYGAQGNQRLTKAIREFLNLDEE